MIKKYWLEWKKGDETDDEMDESEDFHHLSTMNSGKVGHNEGGRREVIYIFALALYI